MREVVKKLNVIAIRFGLGALAGALVLKVIDMAEDHNNEKIDQVFDWLNPKKTVTENTDEVEET